MYAHGEYQTLRVESDCHFLRVAVGPRAIGRILVAQACSRWQSAGQGFECIRAAANTRANLEGDVGALKDAN